MALETLDFEEPIAVLLKELEALTVLPRTDARDRQIDTLKRRLETTRSQGVPFGDELDALATEPEPFNDCNHNGVEDAVNDWGMAFHSERETFNIQHSTLNSHRRGLGYAVLLRC